MESLAIYHSQFGNTRTLAEIIGGALEVHGRARAVSVAGEQAVASSDLIEGL